MTPVPETLGTPGRIIRFGPYEADLAAGELRRRGRQIRIQEQPFQVLAVLLERPGDVVTREQLRERLWSGDTFVDFDQGLNTAVNKLREALQDSAGAPQYIETLPKRGYRFVCRVESPEPPPAATDSEPPSPAPKSHWRGLPAALVASCIVLAFWLGRASGPEPSIEAPFRRFGIEPPEVPTLQMHHEQSLGVSPDGKRIAAVTGGRLWEFEFERGTWSPIEASVGANSGVVWAPDSKRVAFASSSELRVVSVEDGASTTICELPDTSFYGGSWSPDGEIILFSSGGPANLYEVAAAGGKPRAALTFSQIAEKLGPSGSDRTPIGWLFNPMFLPLGADRRVILLAASAGDSLIVVHDFDRNETSVVTAGVFPVYARSGHLLYVSSQSDSSRDTVEVLAQPFSLELLKTSGSPSLVASGGLSPSVAADGTLVYLDAPAFRLAFVDRAGATLNTVGPVATGYFYPALSPDERMVAVEASHNGNFDIWTHELARDVRMRLSDSPATEILPVWSPSGTELAFGSYRYGSPNMFVRNADGSEAEQGLLPETPEPERIGDWSPDGGTIVYATRHADTGWDIWRLVRSGADLWEPQPFLTTSANERSPKLSSDGRYIAYLSDESGRDEVYVQPFPKGGRKWPVSSEGGAQIRWRKDGRELFYLEAGQLTAVSVQLTPELQLGLPLRLFAPPSSPMSDPNYDATSDGKRFLVPLEAAAERKVRIVQNWKAGL